MSSFTNSLHSTHLRQQLLSFSAPCGGRKKLSPPCHPRSTLEASLQSLFAIQLNYQLLLQLETPQQARVPCVLLFLPCVSCHSSPGVRKAQTLCEKESEFGCKEKELTLISRCECGWRIWVIKGGSCLDPHLLLVACRIGNRTYLCICSEGLGRDTAWRCICSEARAVTSEGVRRSFKSLKLNLNGTLSTVIIYYPRGILWSWTGHAEDSASREDLLPCVLSTEGQTGVFCLFVFNNFIL